MSHAEPTRPSTGNFFEILNKAYQHKMNADQSAEVNSANGVQMQNSILNNTNSKLQKNANDAQKLQKKTEHQQSKATTDKTKSHWILAGEILGCVALAVVGVAISVATGGAAAPEAAELEGDAIGATAASAGAEAGAEGAAEAGTEAGAEGATEGAATGTTAGATGAEIGAEGTTEGAESAEATSAEGASTAGEDGEEETQSVLQKLRAAVDTIKATTAPYVAPAKAGLTAAGIGAGACAAGSYFHKQNQTQNQGLAEQANQDELQKLNTNTQVYSNDAQQATNNASQQFTTGVQNPQTADQAAASQDAQLNQSLAQILSVA